MKKVILLTLINISFITSLKSQKTYVPDDNFEQALIALGFDSGPLDDSVLSSSVDTITNLNISNKNIASVEGISDFVALKYFNVNNNVLTRLDLSRNYNLLEIFCKNNNLSSLNIANGNNTNLNRMHTKNNPSLSCIEVDSVNYSSNSWNYFGGVFCLGCFDIDSYSSYSHDCYSRKFLHKKKINFANLYKKGFGNSPKKSIVPLFPDSTISKFYYSPYVFNNQYVNSMAMIYDKSSYILELEKFYKTNVPTTLDSLSSTGYYIKGRAGHIDTLIYKLVLTNMGNNLINESYLTGQVSNYAFDTVRYKDIHYDSINDTIPGTIKEYKIPLDNTIVTSASGNISPKIYVGIEVSKIFAIIIDYKPGGSYSSSDTMGARIGGYAVNAFELNGPDTYPHYRPNDFTCSYWKKSNYPTSSIWHEKYVPFYAYGRSMAVESLDIDLVISQRSFICDTIRDTINLNCVNQQYVLWKNNKYLFSGNYMFLDTFYNNGCDTLCFLHLNFTRNTFDTIFPISYNNYITPSGKIYSASGNYQDTITNSFGCDSITTIYLTIKNCLAKFGKIQSTIGQVTLLDSTLGNNLKYTWYFGDGDSSVSYLPTHNYLSAGTYNVCLRVLDTIGGCTDYFCDSITVDTSGVLRNSWTLKVIRNIVEVEEINNSRLKVYPNPTTDILNIEFERTGNYSLYSADGKIVFKNKRIESNLTTVDISNLTTGVYLLRVITDQGEIFTKRIIKQ